MGQFVSILDLTIQYLVYTLSMHNLPITDFNWPPGIADKVLFKHELIPEKVEQSFFHREARVRRIGPRYLLLTRTDSGEYIIVVFAYSSHIATIITARPMSYQERHLHARK